MTATDPDVTASAKKSRDAYSKEGVRFLGSIPKHKLAVISKAAGGKDEFQPLVLQPGWFERQCDPEWEERHNSALLNEYKRRIENGTTQKNQSPASTCGRCPSSSCDCGNQPPQRQRLDKYRASSGTKYEHLLFNKDRNPPYAVDKDDGILSNSYNEPLGPHSTTYDIAYNMDEKYKHAKKNYGTGNNRYSHVDYHLNDFSQFITSTNHDAYRATHWLPAEALSSDKKKVVDQLADPFRPAFVHNRFGQPVFDVGCQTAWKFVEGWKQKEFPVEDYRDLIVASGAKKCPDTMRRQWFPTHKSHKLPFANCRDCEDKDLCANGNTSSPSQWPDEYFDPNVPVTGYIEKCNCLSTDPAFLDDDFSPSPTKSVRPPRPGPKKNASEKQLFAKTTQTPNQKDMQTYWAAAEEAFRTRLEDAPESYKQKIQQEKHIITADGRMRKTPYYLLDKTPPSPPPEPYKRKVYSVVPPPSDGWSGYIKGPKVPDF